MMSQKDALRPWVADEVSLLSSVGLSSVCKVSRPTTIMA